MRDNVIGAENQQGSPLSILNGYDPSETTRRAPTSRKEFQAYMQGALHDASLNKGRRYRFTQSDVRWLQVLQKALEMLGYASWIYREGKTRHVYTLESTHLKHSPIFLIFLSVRMSRLKLLNVLRIFADSLMPKAASRETRTQSSIFSIQLVQKDKEKVETIVALLNQLGICTGKVHNPSVRVDPDYWRVFVNTSSHAAFARTIGSWHPRKQALFRDRMMI